MSKNTLTISKAKLLRLAKEAEQDEKRSWKKLKSNDITGFFDVMDIIIRCASLMGRITLLHELAGMIPENPDAETTKL